MATRPTAEVEVEEEENQVTRPSDLGFPQAHREIEVEALASPPVQPDVHGLVEVRIAQTIEEFTYGNPHRSWRLEEGKRYRLPYDVAVYLDSLGYVYHR